MLGKNKDLLKGLGWMGLSRGFVRVVGFLKIAIIAKSGILSPEEFGLFAIAALAVAMLEILTETGINVVLIQERGPIEKYLNTAWIVSIIRGAAISAFIFASSPFIADFFRAEAAGDIIILISVVPLLRGFINPSIVKFRKDLEFNKEFFMRSSVFLLDAVVAVVVSFATGSAVGLVWGMIAGVILEVIISFALVRPIPRLEFDRKKFGFIVKRGKWVTVAGLFNYAFHQGDDIVLGRLLGTGTLGIYQVIYKISILPIIEAGEVFGKVSFPLYSRLMGKKRELRTALVASTVILTALVFPFGSVVFLYPEEIINFTVGPNWLSGAPALKVLAVFGVLRAVSGSASALFLAAKKQEFVATVTFVSFLGVGITVVPLTASYGMVGTSFSALIGALAATPFIIYYSYKIIAQ